MFDWYFQQQQQVLDQALSAKRQETMLILTDGGAKPDYFSMADSRMNAYVSCRPSLGQYDLVSHFEALPFSPKQIDTVVLWYLPHETIDWSALLVEIDLVLAADGRLIVMDFHPWHAGRQEARAALLQEAGALAGRQGQKHRSILPTTLKQHLQAAKLEVTTLRRFGQRQLSTLTLTQPSMMQVCCQALTPWRYLGYLCVAEKKTLGMIVEDTQVWRCAQAGIKRRAAVQPQSRG